jgi:dipeptidyl aminopeptidase/acylaminoacyl peptidase
MSRIKRYDARAFHDTVHFEGASFSADEKCILVTSDASGVHNLYGIFLDDGKTEQLTHSTTDGVYAIGFFPHDDRILYSSDQGGNELNHLYVRETDGRIIDLTPGERLKAHHFEWSEDGTCFWVISNERDPKYFDLYRYDARTYHRERCFTTTGEYGRVAAISRDGHWIALAKNRSNTDNDVYLWDATQPAAPPRLITPHEGEIRYQPQGFSPRAGTLLYLCNRDGEFYRLWAHDPANGAHRLIESADWDIVISRFARNGRFRVTIINADARTEIRVHDEEQERPVTLPAIPRGDITGVEVSRSGKRMAFYVDGDTSPANLHLLDLETGECRRLTRSLSPAIDERDLVEAIVVRYSSFDGLEIPALLLRPHEASQDNKVPAIVYVHGGPGGQARHGYRTDLQFLANHGYAVLAVNNRGSGGYGKTFFHLDDKRHGDVDLKDCIWGRKYLEDLDWIDGSRIAIMGGSYGGYMVAAALAFAPEAFDAGIDIFGVTNWVRTLKSIPPWWESQREYLYTELGDPYREEELLRAKSPLFHAAKIRRPLLVVQGKNDPRVLQVESDELVAAARKNDVPVEYIVFPDEGHGFTHKANRITAAEAYLKFLETYVRGK